MAIMRQGFLRDHIDTGEVIAASAQDLDIVSYCGVGWLVCGRWHAMLA